MNDETPRAKMDRILTFGLLAQAATIPIDARKAFPEADHTGPALGNYGKWYLPITLDGARFSVPLSPKNPDFDALCAVFGEDPTKWAGSTIRVSDGTVLKQVRVAAIAARAN